MRKATAALAVLAMTLTMALSAAAKPASTDTLAFGWDGGSIVYDDGLVTVDIAQTGFVDCWGAQLIATTVWSGAVPGTLDIRNPLRAGTLTFETDGLEGYVIGGCGEVSESLPATVVLDFATDEKAVRWRDADGRHIQRSGTSLTPFSVEPVGFEFHRVIS